MTKRPRLLLLTPPLLQTNSPYPATPHLTGFLRRCGYEVQQRDLGIKVVRAVLEEHGGDETAQLIELLQGPAPADAKLAASAAVEEVAAEIKRHIDPQFGFARYAERLAAGAMGFGEVQQIVARRGVIDAPLEAALERAVDETRPTHVGVACPFPGTLVGAFKIARWLRRHRPAVKLALGGGFVSTELRETDDLRVRRYFDVLILDEGYAPVARWLGPPRPGAKIPGVADVPPFVAPCYDGIDFADYFDVVETANPMHRLWSVGRWRKLQLARGCYWHRCAFCDVVLPYINCFEQPDCRTVADALTDGGMYHFTDEAMPPGLLERLCHEILRRGLHIRWWGNIRFDRTFTPRLARLMARAGCIAVTGGLECADDRLLKLMNKGITIASAEQALKAFRNAGIMVHAYLMYAFPTQTAGEALSALERVRDWFRRDLLQSAFYHRFALTVHSPIAREPHRFGIEVAPECGRRRRIFRRNEIDYREPGAPDWDRIGSALQLAVSNFQEGRGLNRSAAFWLRFAEKSATPPSATENKKVISRYER